MKAQPSVLVAAGAAAGFAVTAGAAWAHHGWGSYDASQKITIASPVERLQWQNPHVRVYLRHEGATWEIVLAPPFRMEARGLAPDLIKPGVAITAEGYPSTRNAREMRAERITVAERNYELR